MLCVIVLMASETCASLVLPSCDRLIDSSMSWAVSFAAWALRWASVRTSSATTAKPVPASPARAASTAAFRARILVWKAMPSITLIIFEILSLDALICYMEVNISASV